MKPLIHAAHACALGPRRAVISCTRTASGAVVCRCAGDIDPDRAPATTQALLAALDHGRPPALFVDLAAVDYFCAAGLASLLKVREAAAVVSVPLTLVAPSLLVSRVLEVTDTRDLFTVVPRLQTASGAG